MKLLWRTFARGVYKDLGLDSPYSAQEYGVNWTKQRNKCLERDDYIPEKRSRNTVIMMS